MPTLSTAAASPKKSATPRKATKTAPKPVTEDRSHAAWLVRDDKLLVASLSMDIYAIAASLQRDPLTVLRRLIEPRVVEALTVQGLNFEFDNGSEEQAELYGLTLCGVPVIQALQWCLAKDERPTTAQLGTLMTTADFRPAMYMARDMNICFSHIDQMDDLRSLEQDWPLEIVQAGVEDVIARFDIPTAETVMALLEGEPQERVKPYAWFDNNGTSGAQPNKSARGYKRKSKSTYSRSTTWKPYRKSRRSYGAKRSYA